MISKKKGKPTVREEARGEEEEEEEKEFQVNYRKENPVFFRSFISKKK